MIIDEFANIPLSCPDVQVTGGMGFGRPVTGVFDPALLHHHAHGFMQSVSVVAKSLGIKLDDIEVFGEMAGRQDIFRRACVCFCLVRSGCLAFFFPPSLIIQERIQVADNCAA